MSRNGKMWPQSGKILGNENKPRSGRDMNSEAKDFKRVIIKGQQFKRKQRKEEISWKHKKQSHKYSRGPTHNSRNENIHLWI